VSQDSIWIKQEDYLEPRFGITDRDVTLIFEAKDGGNVLTADAIREMFALYDSMAAVTTETDGNTYSFQNGVCWKSATEACRTNGVLKYFNNSAVDFERAAAQGSDAVLQALSAPTYPDGTVATLEAAFVGAQTDSNGTLVSATSALWVRFMLREQVTLVRLDPRLCAIVEYVLGGFL
jgi:hypothetical protein